MMRSEQGWLIIVVIMIKSSDPSFSNTYRILKVLSNHDYLATDQADNHYIFSQTDSLIQSPPFTHPPPPCLLPHRELITVDGVRYAVFAVGGEVLWASLMSAKRLQQEAFVEKLIKRSIQSILKELIWMGSLQARHYLNLKNLWLIDQQLQLLLVPRPTPHKFSIKKCEKRALSQERSMDSIMEAERTLVKDFALMLWEVCFQCVPNEDRCVTAHIRSKQLLRTMISKAVSFEDLLSSISKHSFDKSSSKQSRLKSIQQDLFRKKTFTSFEKPYHLKTRLSNDSLLTQQSKPFRTIQQSFARLTDSTPSRQSTLDARSKSMSADDTYMRDSAMLESKILNRIHTQASSKQTIQYDRWLQNRKYSVQIREKLHRNGELARKKFSQAIIENCRQEKQEKLDDATFKERVLAKVIKFKTAMKARQDSPYQYQPLQKNLQDMQKQQERPIEEASEIRLQFDLKESQSQQSQQTLRNTVAEAHSLSTSSQNGEKGQIGVHLKPDVLVPQQKGIQVNETPTEKKKPKRMDLLNSAGEIQEELQVVELQQPQRYPSKQTQPPPQTLPFPNRPPPPIPVREGKLVSAEAGVSQLTMLINTLGDITVRTVKAKDKLKEINWRQATYFLYQRFLFERSRLLKALTDSQPISRSHRRIDPKDWKQYIQAKRTEIVRQMTTQNEQITGTLNRLGQKLLQEQQLQRKIEYFVRNRDKVSVKSDSKLRLQLSRFLLSCMISQFDFAWEEKLKREEVLTFLTDLRFAAYVMGEFDGVIPADKFIRMDQYKEYGRTLDGLKPSFDYIDQLYFGKEDDWETL